MNPRAAELIRALDLAPHPEGGFYRETQVLGPAGLCTEPVLTVPADWWQAARPVGTHALCGCTVAPGFEFGDFSFLRDDPDSIEGLRGVAPELLSLL